MASVGEPTHSKRPHVATEKMQEFIRGSVSPTKQKMCPVEGCNKMLTSDPGLRYHIQAHHSQQKDFVCDTCGRSFKSSNGLKYHHKKKQKCDKGMVEEEAMDTTDKHSVSEASSGDTRKNIPYPLELCSSPEGDKKVEQWPLMSTLSIPVTDTVSHDKSAGDSRLIEFAQFATSPQSPLMQTVPTKPWEQQSSAIRCMKTFDYGVNVNENATYHELKPAVLPSRVDDSSKDNNGNYCDDGSDSNVTSSSPYPASPFLHQNVEGTWTHTWPKAIWKCFIRDTKVCFEKGEESVWQTVESLAKHESLVMQAASPSKINQQSYGSNGLRLCAIKRHGVNEDNMNSNTVHLHFTPDIIGQANMWAECSVDHPFFVRDKGWSSCSPEQTADSYGIPCNDLQENDVCLPPDHPDARPSDEVFQNLKSFELTPQDSSAVLALSQMAKKATSSPKSGSGSPTKKRPLRDDDPKRPKRPMNAFMLFAKEKRLTLTQDFPGKDNRAISVILGDKWKKLSDEERLVYEENAKVLADQQKKLHPNCWKRKK